MSMTPDPITDAITALFTTPAGFRLARWGRPIAPVAFGLDDATLAVLKPAMAAVFRATPIATADTDPQTGANLLMFFAADWAELRAVPDLDRLTGLPDLAARLEGRSTYRLFRFDDTGAIRAHLAFVKPDPADHPAALGERLAVNAALTFAQEVTPSAAIARLLTAAYDPRLPAAATDPATALRLAARLG